MVCRKPLFAQAPNRQISLIDVIGQLTLSSDQPLKEAERSDRPVFNNVELSIVSMWFRSEAEEPETATLRYEVLCPDGESLLLSESPIDLESQATHRVILNMPVVPIRGVGFYYWITKLRQPRGKAWREVARVPVELRIQEPEEPSEAGPES